MRQEHAHHASDELILVAVIALVAIGSLIMIAPSSTDPLTDTVTGKAVIADRESTLPAQYDYKGALERGKLIPTSKKGCPVCTSGTLRPSMSQVYSLCTGDYAVRLNLVSSLKNRVIFDVNGELFDAAADDKLTLRDGMNFNVNSINSKNGQQMMSFELGALTYTGTLNSGDSTHFTLCDRAYAVSVNSVSADPKTVSLMVNGENFVLGPSEARPLKGGKTLTVWSIDAKQDRWGSVNFEIS